MPHLRENPYEIDGNWYYVNEKDDTVGPFDSMRSALRALLRHMDRVEGVSWWSRVKGWLA